MEYENDVRGYCKIGDLVLIQSVDWYGQKRKGATVQLPVPEGGTSTINFTDDMSQYCGRVAEVVGFVNNRIKLDIDNQYWNWVPEMFEKILQNKFKVGDKVTIKSREWFEQHAVLTEDDGNCVVIERGGNPNKIYFTSEMAEFCGKETIIVGRKTGMVNSRAALQDLFSLDIDRGVWTWSPEMFEWKKDTRLEDVCKALNTYKSCTVGNGRVYQTGGEVVFKGTGRQFMNITNVMEHGIFGREDLEVEFTVRRKLDEV